MRTTKKINITDIGKFKTNLLAWAQQFDKVVWLDSNDAISSSLNSVLAVSMHTEIKCNYKNSFNNLILLDFKFSASCTDVRE